MRDERQPFDIAIISFNKFPAAQIDFNFGHCHAIFRKPRRISASRAADVPL